MTVTCSIVEDEPLALQLIQAYVQRTPFLQLKKTYLDAELLALDIQRGDLPMLLFSDIQMPQINGIELSRLLPNSTKVIFTTAYSRYALDGFKVSALDFLLKPISYDDFLASATKARDWFEKEQKVAHADHLMRQSQPMLQVKSERHTVVIPIADIIRIEGLKDYVKIIRRDGTVTISLMRMKKMMDLLPQDQFVRVHKSHIVRTSEITSFDKSHLSIGGDTIPVSNNIDFNKFEQINSNY
ncbi:MAG: response regulator transcription factor [Bacteroidales bacterium]|nr:response regulator transcription factor [Bacteroidales bacterium]